MKTKKQYLVFISYGHGSHFNTVVDSVENVIEVLNNSCDEIEQNLLDDVLAKATALENEKNFYAEFNHGTWATITRMDIEIPVYKTEGLDDRELTAVLSGLRHVQRYGYIEEYLDGEVPLDEYEIDELCQMLNSVEPLEKPANLNQSLKDRIRDMAEGLAVSNYTSQDNTVSYERFMASENVHKITSIWEPFETDTTENIQSNVENDARNLVGFAEAIIATVTTSDMLDIIGQRAYDAGVVNSRGNICLTSIHSITASQRDAAERCNGAWPVNDGNVFIDTEEYDGNDQIVKNAAKFGATYVLAV